MGVNCDVTLEFEGNVISQVQEYRYLGLMVYARSSSPAYMLKARILAA